MTFNTVEPCPHCGDKAILDLAKTYTIPEPADICICKRCYKISLFTNDLKLREAGPGDFSEEEMDAILDAISKNKGRG